MTREARMIAQLEKAPSGPPVETLTTWVIVPAFQEAQAIADTLAEVMTSFSQIVVVDDGSDDGTADIALRCGAHVCRHCVNQGQGSALQTGFEYALQRGAVYIVTFDADGQHRASDAAEMVDALVKYGVDVVLGSRFLGSTESIGALRLQVLRAATWYTRITTGMKLTDTHNGLRVLTARAAKALQLRQGRMAHASEILDRIASLGLKYMEWPVTIRYSEYSRRKGQKLTAAFDILFDIFFDIFTRRLSK